MGKWVAALAAVFFVFLVSGCNDSNPSPLLGTWESTGTGASIRLEEGGDCRYYRTSAGGFLCEWESTGEGEARITVKSGASFTEGDIRLVGNALFFDTPSGGVDIFEK